MLLPLFTPRLPGVIAPPVTIEPSWEYCCRVARLASAPLRPPGPSIAPGAALILLLSATTCSGNGPGVPPPSCRPVDCPSGWFSYDDTGCGPPDIGSGPSCFSNGDGLCYRKCVNDGDCLAVGLATCGSLTFFKGDDTGEEVGACNGTATLPACGSSGDSGTDSANHSG